MSENAGTAGASPVLTERRDGLLIITLNRPERRNAMNSELLQGLMDAVRDAAEDSSVRAVLLTGAGGNFCVGGDVKAMNEGKHHAAELSETERTASLRERMEAARLLHEMPKPTVAAIEGAAAGAGFSLALSCDFRVANRSAKLTTAFAKVGLSGDYGGSYFLTHLVGAARAKELYLLSPVLSGDQAADMGLVTKVVEDGAAFDEGVILAQQLAEGPTLTLAAMKSNCNLAETGSLSDCLDQEAANHVRSSFTADHKEAAAAFVEKRPPVFKGA